MNKIVSILGKKVIFVTHINLLTEKCKTLPSRENLIELVESYGTSLQLEVFNQMHLVRKYGQSIALRNDGKDLDHYNPFFFQVVGCHIFENHLVN